MEWHENHAQRRSNRMNGDKGGLGKGRPLRLKPRSGHLERRAQGESVTWQELIKHLCAECGFSSPATQDQVAEVEQALGLAIPNELKQLLLESNGVQDQTMSDMIWSADKIIRENLMYRNEPGFKELYMPFDP